MHTRGKPYLVLLLIVFLLILSMGCSSSYQDTNNEGKNDIPNKNIEEHDINLPVYFVEFSSNDAYLIREIHTIPHTKQVANAAMQVLIKDKKSILPPGTKILGININNGLATVDFSEEVLNANLGSSGEALGIQSIVNTLTGLPNIEKVSFQVNGRTDGRAQDWWGHVGLYNQPFTKDYSKVYKPAIWVTHPSPHQVVGVPLLVKGSALVYEGTVNARLLDSNGKILAETYTTTSGAPVRGDFAMSIKFDPPSSGEGVLEVFDYSPKDGSPQDIVSIPVQWP
ncbi:Immunoglobulin-like domain of bacterial spore germination [Sporotomaculum syntrophicum]|uniref:Immunoglobulin-like domain of bacterial spore germination n=1 Tax=Sporotomaculum syntrophicum TaxID=182264 RepID=A0A9D2WNN7_9FIRM|nr:Gmad2 immunoglobulin-like domain-containing protein [Sporotomaculum syntrophicum]KAF1084243.1 Immunoglobulin-like domain of bacterial spore germination [Sporotomaculum syntrophicum]